MSLKNRHVQGEPWQFQEAKARLSEVVDISQRDGPQVITRRGENTAVVMSYDEYIRLKQATTTIAEALAGAPGELPWQRDPRPFKVVDLE